MLPQQQSEQMDKRGADRYNTVEAYDNLRMEKI